MALISCQNVSMSYGHSLALNDVSFEASAGEYICIVGENGSGKSTLLKGILGLMPLKSGTIHLGDNVHPGEIGYLPQQTPVQRDFPASVFEVVISGCLAKRGLMPFYSKKEKELALVNMDRLGIGEIREKCYRNLSGGQQQRVLLARALCATKKLLILDEPTTGLDPAMTVDFYALVKKLNREAGLTIVMTSHDIHAAVTEADKILHLDSGVLFFGTAEDYLQSEVSRHFMGGEHLGHC